MWTVMPVRISMFVVLIAGFGRAAVITDQAPELR